MSEYDWFWLTLLLSLFLCFFLVLDGDRSSSFWIGVLVPSVGLWVGSFSYIWNMHRYHNTINPLYVLLS